MNILHQKWVFLNQTERYVPGQISKLYRFGLETLCSRTIVSLRANARLVPLNWNTAKSKIYRLVSNARIPLVFIVLLKSLSMVGGKDIIAVDFSDFGNGFQVLMFAKQTKRGRAVPLYFEILRYPIRKDSQNLFIIQAIENFSHIVGGKPCLIFDRGFASPYIVQYLFKNKHIFILRIKKKKSAIDVKTGRIFLVQESSRNDISVDIYGKRLRLVISDQPTELKEPWYLITNDFTSARKKIIDRYYHRFEIEELFRDAKRLLNLEHVRFEKELSLATTLWFAILGIWFFSTLDERMDESDERSRQALCLSVTRYFFETLQWETFLLSEGRFLNLPGNGNYG